MEDFRVAGSRRSEEEEYEVGLSGMGYRVWCSSEWMERDVAKKA